MDEQSTAKMIAVLQEIRDLAQYQAEYLKEMSEAVQRMEKRLGKALGDEERPNPYMERGLAGSPG